MRALRAWLRRVASTVAGRCDDRALDDELAAHLQMHIDDNRRAGMSDAEARRVALVRLGGLEQARELYRERRGLPVLETAARDLRFAARLMRRSPGFTAGVVAILAVGIGGITAAFAIVDAVLLRPLPFEQPDRLVMVWERRPSSQRGNVVSVPNFRAWQERTRSFTALAAYAQMPMNLLGSDAPVQVTGATVTADFFRVLGIEPALGRTYLPDEDQPNRAPAVVLGHAVWVDRFGARPDIVGTRISINATHHDVIGVMPKSFVFPDSRVQLFVPLVGRQDRGRNYAVIARLRPGVAMAAAQQDVIAVAAQTSRENPRGNADWSAMVVPLQDEIVGPSGRPLLVVFAAVGLVLLIACVNIANLLLMRAAMRQREFAVRLALGAGRWRLLQQALVEAVTLSLLGAALGVALAIGAVEAFVRMVPAAWMLPRLHEVAVDSRVLLFAAAMAAGSALLLALVPACFAGVAHRDLSTAGASRSVTSRHRRTQRMLVVAEVALAVPLVVAAGLMLHSLMRLSRVDPGFRPERVLTVHMLLLPVRDRALHAAFIDDVLTRLRTAPGVIAAGSIGRLPLSGGNSGTWYYRADRAEPPAGARPGGDLSIVTPGYFPAMRIPLVRGRDFVQADRLGAPGVGIINQTAARRLYGDEDPIGKRLTVSWNDAREVEIVGVVGDTRHSQLSRPPDPCLFLPNGQQPFPFAAVVIRTADNPLDYVPMVTREIRAVDPDQGVSEVLSMDQFVDRAVAVPRAQAVLLGGFGAVAVALGCIGVYGVLAYSVTQRQREIGLRIALGAAPAAAFALVLREGLWLIVAGLCIGLGTSVILTRFMQGLLYEVAPLDPVVLPSAAALALLLGAGACVVPGLRAARVDPAIVLRDE